MTARRVAAVLVLGSLAVASACSNLPPAELDACGDGIVDFESGEDCDREGAGCGAPDTPQACRLTCFTSDDCPAAATCGVNGVCSVPTGAFTYAGEQPWTARYLLVGDTDGAGDPELIGVDDLTIDVRIGGPGASFGPAEAMANLPISEAPRLADLTGDRIADVVESVGIGLNVLVGNPEALLAPSFQATLPVPSEGPVVTASVRFQDTPANGGLPSSAVLLALRIPFAPPECPLPAGCEILLVGEQGIGLPRALDRLAGDRVRYTPRPPFGDADEEITIALPFVDDPDVVGDQSGVWLVRSILATDDLPLPPALTLLGQVSVPQGRVLDAHFADLNGDGMVDLLITIEDAVGASSVVVALGRADATFAAPVEVRARPYAMPLEPFETLPPPMLWADVDGDHRADLIGPQYIIGLTGCPGAECAYRVGALFEQPWSHVAVGDVDGNGRTDVIGSRPGAATVDVLLGTGTLGLWNDSSFVSAADVRAVRVGDFDGNGVDDVALVVAADAADDNAALEVAFGRSHARIAPPTVMGTIGDVVAIEPVVAPVPGRVDDIDDLLVVADRAGDRRGAILFGSTSQRMVAPLIPAEPPQPPVSGTFSILDAAMPIESDSGTTIAALVTSFVQRTEVFFETSLRFYTSDGEGLLAEHYAGRIALLEAAFVQRGALWTAIPGVGGSLPLVIGTDLEGRVAAVPIAGCPSNCQAMMPQLLASNGLGRPAALLTADLDRQGAQDVIGLFVPGDRPAELVIWRGGTGTPERTALPADVTPHAVTALTTVVGAPAMLAVAATGGDRGDGAVLVALPDGSGRYPSLVAADRDGIIDGIEPAAVGLATADVDGDGLDDLIVTSGADPRTPRALTIYTQIARPGGAGLAAGGN